MKFKEYDLVKLKEGQSGLEVGVVGVVVMTYEKPPAYEVEFCDDEGITIQLLTLKEDSLELEKSGD